jgi:hypothetical protein
MAMVSALRFGGVRAGRGVGIKAVSRERDRAEGEAVQVEPIGDARVGRPAGSAGSASVRGRLDGQDGQLPVGQGALARPGAQ